MLSIYPSNNTTLLLPDDFHLRYDVALVCLCLCTLFFIAVNIFAHRLGSNLIPQKIWNSLSSTKKIAFGNEVGSFVHSLIVSFACLDALLYPTGNWENDRIYGASDKAAWIFSFSSAYFIVDLMYMFTGGNLNLPMLSHHLAGIAVYLTCQSPFMQFYGVCGLLYELSTPFLTLRSMHQILGLPKDNLIYQSIEYSFVLTFFLCRFAFGLPISMLAIYEGGLLAFNGNLTSPISYAILTTANTGINCLNCWWMAKIVKMVGRNMLQKKID